MGSLVGYGMLAYVLMLAARGHRRTQWAIVAMAGALITAIGLSRMYLGVHYFSDVVGGYAAGLLWLSACVTAVELGRRWRRRSLRLNPTG
jgi:undecaprenyl-diphosphatase